RVLLKQRWGVLFRLAAGGLIINRAALAINLGLIRDWLSSRGRSTSHIRACQWLGIICFRVNQLVCSHFKSLSPLLAACFKPLRPSIVAFQVLLQALRANLQKACDSEAKPFSTPPCLAHYLHRVARFRERYDSS